MNPLRQEFLSSFGRNRGKKLSSYQQGLVETLLPQLEIGNGEMEKWRNDFLQFPNSPIPQFSKIALEIGFGGGEHLIGQALHNPDTLFIGVEPYINGVAKALAAIADKNLTNIRLNTNDARLLVKALPDACLDSVFILFPDPWPKERHKKRRLVNQETLELIARTHKPGGRLLIASDHEDYCGWILEQLHASPHYRWTAREQADWLTPPADWTQTKYQRKTTAQGRPAHFFECVRD